MGDNMQNKNSASSLLVWLMICPFGVGCGRNDIPELGQVEGRVSARGKPLPGVMVQFIPESGGRPGSGVTNEEGHFELTYTADYAGTKVGPNRVEITTIWPDGEPPPGEQEKIPVKYNAQSELKEEVKPGDNFFDFNLELTAEGSTK
jgi:hypothetical protein